jgi:hypothetical protein
VPLSLPGFLRALQRSCRGPLVSIFHELYASGSWRQSAFWLRPMQMRIARAIAQISDASIVSSDVFREQLQRLAPDARAVVHPIFSAFGEPALLPDQMSARDPHRWLICGGTELIERSLRSFLARLSFFPERSIPREVCVVGGADNVALRESLRAETRINAQYFPEVEAVVASEILKSCAFAWIDYFDHPDIPTGAILKSSGFAACCAHGVIPVFPHAGSVVALRNDALPGPFFVGAAEQNLPTEAERSAAAASIYAWYQRNSSSPHLAATVAAALGQPS